MAMASTSLPKTSRSGEVAAAGMACSAGSSPAFSNPAEAEAAKVKRQCTMIALCLMSFIKGADMQLLPSSFRAMEVDLHLEPHQLGLLALCQGVACSFSGPLWGNLVDCGLSRLFLLVVGTTTWGICTLLLGFITTLERMAVIRAMNGIALASLLPVTQSFVVDLSEKNERGYVFGWLYFCANMGQVLATLFVTPMSSRVVFGIAGWRLALVVVGVASLGMALVLPMLVVEEPRVWRHERFGLRVELSKFGRFLQIPTFVVIILQGVFGTIPGAAMAFSTMYFQYTGISDSMSAMINALRIIGDACGGLLGGLVGDMMAYKSPLFGRTIAAQISVITCIPCIWLIFNSLPRDEASTTYFAGILFLHGVLGVWPAPGCICPYMCDIIPKRNLASAYAWELAVVFASGNTLGPLIVGSLSQDVFGYKLSRHQVSDMDPVTREQNAEALGLSLLYASIIPYMACALLFSLMFCTYPRDMEAAESGDMGTVDGENSEAEQATESTRLLYAATAAAPTRPASSG